MKEIKILDGKRVVYPDAWKYFEYQSPEISKAAGVVAVADLKYVFTCVKSIADMSAEEEMDILKKLAYIEKNVKKNKDDGVTEERVANVFAIVNSTEDYRKYAVTRDAWIQDGGGEDGSKK